MQIKAHKTHKIRPGENLEKILDKYIPKLEENSVVVVTSKIVSICEGNIIKNDGNITKETLVKQHADYYLEQQVLGYSITITNNILILNAGIDESNANDYFVLWPKNPQTSALKIWEYLRGKHNIQNLGIIITDSHMIALRWGVRGVGMAWCGFQPMKDYVGKPDIFGKPLKTTKASMIDGLAASAVMVMGEGNEQTPLAVITDIPFIQFQAHPPTKEEIQAMKISREDDIYGPMLQAVKWKKGGNKISNN